MMRILFVTLALLFALATNLLAQQVIPPKFDIGGEKPEQPGHLDWYLDTLTHEAWLGMGGKWYLYRKNPVQRMVACGDFLIVDGDTEDRVDGPLEDQRLTAFRIYCVDSVIVLIRREDIVIIPAYFMKYPRSFVRGGDCMSKYHESQIVNGIEAFCVAGGPYNVPGQCWERRDYGMLGIHGKWLVEPLFDEPFRFENGFAWVKYYGRNRKINEKGEFVE